MEYDDEVLNFCLLIAGIIYYNSCRNRSYLTRSAIQPPKLSAWNHLLNFGDDKSFTEMTGMTRSAFMLMETVVFPEIGDDRRKRGRPPALDNRAQLGLYLFFIGSRMTSKY